MVFLGHVDATIINPLQIRPPHLHWFSSVWISELHLVNQNLRCSIWNTLLSLHNSPWLRWRIQCHFVFLPIKRFFKSVLPQATIARKNSGRLGTIFRRQQSAAARNYSGAKPGCDKAKAVQCHCRIIAQPSLDFTRVCASSFSKQETALIFLLLTSHFLRKTTKNQVRHEFGEEFYRDDDIVRRLVAALTALPYDQLQWRAMACWISCRVVIFRNIHTTHKWYGAFICLKSWLKKFLLPILVWAWFIPMRFVGGTDRLTWLLLHLSRSCFTSKLLNTRLKASGLVLFVL